MRWCGCIFFYRHRTPLECGGADIPIPRIAAQAAVFAGDIYVFGGYSRGKIRGEKDHKIVEVYNTRTNTWSRTRDMLTLRRGFRTAVVDGKIYVIGGAIFDRQRDIRVATDLVEVYDPLTERWKKRASSRCQWRNLCARRFYKGTEVLARR